MGVVRDRGARGRRRGALRQDAPRLHRRRLGHRDDDGAARRLARWSCSRTACTAVEAREGPQRHGVAGHDADVVHAPAGAHGPSAGAAACARWPTAQAATRCATSCARSHSRWAPSARCSAAGAPANRVTIHPSCRSGPLPARRGTPPSRRTGAGRTARFPSTTSSESSPTMTSRSTTSCWPSAPVRCAATSTSTAPFPPTP